MNHFARLEVSKPLEASLPPTAVIGRIAGHVPAAQSPVEGRGAGRRRCALRQRAAACDEQREKHARGQSAEDAEPVHGIRFVIVISPPY